MSERLTDKPQRGFEIVRADDGGESRIWLDGEIDIIKDTPGIEGFKAAKALIAERDKFADRLDALQSSRPESAHTENAAHPESNPALVAGASAEAASSRRAPYSHSGELPAGAASDTPRTDTLIGVIADEALMPFSSRPMDVKARQDLIDFARQLERELAEAKRQLGEAFRTADAAEERGYRAGLAQSDNAQAPARTGTTPTEREPSAATPGKPGTEARHESAASQGEPKEHTGLPTYTVSAGAAPDTPRTDAAVFPSAAMSASDRWAHLVYVARQIECDLADKTICAAKLQAILDECRPWLKEGETPAQRIEREWKDSQRLLGELAASRSASGDSNAEKDEAYRQRNVLVAALTRLYPSGIRKTNIEGWSDDWHGCVYIDLPDGQISYHYHDSQAHLFDGLPPYTKKWDEHSKADVERRLGLLRSASEESK